MDFVKTMREKRISEDVVVALKKSIIKEYQQILEKLNVGYKPEYEKTLEKVNLVCLLKSNMYPSSFVLQYYLNLK